MNYTDFLARSPLTQQEYHCQFVYLQTAISLRHSDTVDVKFRVNGTGVVVALPHTAWVEYLKKSGRPLTDQKASQAAASLLQEALERGDDLELLDLHPTTAKVLAKMGVGG